MKNARRWKTLALCGALTLSLGLSGCYIPPDDLSGDLQNISPGSDSDPFQNVVVTEAPTATPTIDVVGAFATNAPDGPLPTIDWDNLGSAQPTNAGSLGTTNPGGVNNPGGTLSGPTASPTLRPGSIVSITSNPTTTRPATPTASPAPSSLKVGSKGDAVRSLQQRLKDLKYYSGSVDGDFGAGTEAAVKAFQAANGLTVDGKAGAQTLAKLNSSTAVAAASATATPRRTATPTPRRTATPTPRRTATPTPRATATPDLSREIYLRIGSSGKDVTRLQERLISLGWMIGSADGDFGGATEAAVIAFQKKTSGLWDDGVAGPDTLRALYSSGAAKSSSAVSSVGMKLQSGSEGAAVRALQKRLRALGYLTESADGSYGEKTRAAVIAFQTGNGLKVDGIAGTDTLNAIYASTALSAADLANNTGSDGVGSTGYITLREGDKSEAVARLQRALKNLGLYSGDVDGSYGSGTTAAVRTFQSMNRLRVDGVAGPATQRALFGTNATATYETLRPGDEGSAVTNLQYTLYELGYYDGQIDGIYSDLTKNAVADFQITNNITPVDGIAGNKTLQALYSSSARPAGSPSTNFETLRPGDEGNAVFEMQDALKQLGYLSEITAIYDDATYQAVMAFQRRNGLNADGIAGNETLTVLYSNSAVSNY